MITFAQIADQLIPAAHALLEDNMRPYQDQNRYNWHLGCINVSPTDSWENQLVSMTSTRLWPEYKEGAPLNITTWGDEDSSLFSLAEYQDGFTVSRRYLRYGDPSTAMDQIFPKLAVRMRQFAQRGLLRHSELASLILTDAFDGSIHTGIDGLPLASTVHPLPDGTTFDNKSGLPLTPAALSFAFEGATEITDEFGVPLDINYDTLIIGPALKETAWEILNNSVKPGASNDERNYWPGQITKLVICPWLIEKVHTGASSYWFLQDSNVHTLTGYVGEMPTVLDEPKIDPMQMIVLALTSGVYGWHSWQGMFCSDGGS